MDNGYPSQANILTYLSARGIEEITDSNVDFRAEFLKHLYNLLASFDWAGALRVYATSTTTFNVVGGNYLYNSIAKTFAPSAAVDPTDNDTTYVWLTSAGVLTSGIDGDGWPATDHIKLAEIDVDSDGIITAIRDLRGKNFMAHNGTGTGSQPITLKATLAAGSTVALFTTDAPFKFQIIDAWSIAKSADAGTWKLTDGTNNITDTVAVTAVDKTINRAGTIDDAYSTIDSGDSLSVVGDAANADCDVFITILKID